TPPTTAVSGMLSFAAVEGDYGITPEQIAANGVPLTNAANPVDNPFNGPTSAPSARNPAFVNNFGFDADEFAIDLAQGSTEVRIDITSASDRFRVAAVGIVIPV